MALKNHLAARMARSLHQFWGGVGLSLLCAHTALATIPLYENTQESYYTIPGNPPPTIDATTFANSSVFSVTYGTYSTMTTLTYETRNTLNYFNDGNGLMTFNSPLTTNGFINAYGLTARFDNYNPALNNNFLSASFVNQGTIRVDSVLDGNNIFEFSGVQLYILTSLGQCIISATNITNPGNIVIGTQGFLKMTGEQVDLSRGIFTMEDLLTSSLDNTTFGQLNTVRLNSTGTFGANTNFPWNPFSSLTATSAVSSYSPFPNILNLTNSQAYFDVRNPDPSNFIYRVVFVMNQSPNAPYNVYIHDPNAIELGFEPGAAHVEWVGSTLDPATGVTQTNYLYLTDNYLLGASTNVFLTADGYPNNFSFATSTTPLLANPTAQGFLSVFNNGFITNRYAYMNGQILASSVSTNISVTNPHGGITNLPGRFQITASQRLNLDNAIISGQNYLSLTATNQFDGSAGAHISSPFADLNLGVTNGSLSLSNLLVANLPKWSGSIQAWSTRWVDVDVNGVTNDFRVLLVASQLQPTSVPFVQNLALHATTNLVISDTLNVYSSLAIDSQRLTITTNGYGNGATSAEGELNWIGSGTVGPVQLPNLRWLTNNGALRTANLLQLVGSGTNVMITPGTSAATAVGTLSEVSGRTNVLVNHKVTVGTNLYVFVGKLTNTIPNQVKLAPTFDGSMSNLIAAINRAAGAGTNYTTNTPANPLAFASPLTNHAFLVTAKTNGVAGNSVVTTTTSTNLTWNGQVTLIGGVNAVAPITNVSTVTVPYAAVINRGVIASAGTTIVATNFVSTGLITNGVGNFSAKADTITLTDGSIFAGGSLALTANTLFASNVVFQSLSLTLAPTNLIDAGLVSSNFWTVGRTNGTGGPGFALLVKPPTGDLLGTTITNICPAPNKAITNIWAGKDFGATVQGYSNNMALGRLILSAPALANQIAFRGTTISNALYVDYLELRDQATNLSSSQVLTLSFSTNFVLYYAQAVVNGVSVAEKLNGFNNNRLRWVRGYAGQFSSTTVVYPNGTTNTLNAALVSSPNIDSDGDGIDNAHDASPVFLSSQIGFALTLTNLPPLKARVTWNSIPSATNYLYYTTNLAASVWLPILTNVSPSTVPPVGGWPITNVVEYLLNPVQPAFYRVRVDPAN